MANGVITWNGVASDTLGIVVSKVPSLNRPQRKFNSYSVPGRNGDLVVMQDAYAEYEQEYEIFALDGAQVDARAIVDWLYQDGWCKLADDWEPEYYRMAYFVGPLDIETLISEAAVCTITFRCRPQRFLVENPVSVASGDTITNDTNHIAKPIITLTGNGARSLFPLTLKSLSTSGITGLTGELSRFLNAWNNGKVYWVKPNDPIHKIIIATAGTNQNNGVISVISAQDGLLKFTTADVSWGLSWIVEVSPNTDYVLSMSAYKDSKVIIWFANADGYNKITGYAEMNISANSRNSIQFKTSESCGYIMVGLYSLTNGTDVIFRNIMLTTGTEEKPFRPWTSSTTNVVTINDTSLRFDSSGFNTGLIDCERENFILDDSEANNVSSIVDVHGNMSMDYLQLNKGTNTVTFSGDIASVTIDKRLWQL